MLSGNDSECTSLPHESFRVVVCFYYFHGDHLGTATFVTNSQSQATQFFLNLPFAETMIEQMDGSYDNPFKFNAKELDDDTGLYYYGARYYNPRLSIWYGVDPLAEDMPSWSPYAYSFDNPVRYTDPDGMAPVDPKPGFWKGFFTSVGRGLTAAGRHIMNNPSHAGYGYSPNMKTPKVSDFAPYQVNWGQQLDPTWQAQSFSSMAVQGVSGFVGGIVSGDGAKTAQSIPKLVGTFGFLSLLRSKGVRNVDLMGGPETSMSGYKNFDLADNGLGISDFASNFGNYFKPGSLKNILVNNPQATFLDEISASLAKGGSVTVRGTINNKYFKSIFNGTADGMNNFGVVSRRTWLSNEGYKKTNGTPIGGSNNINEIILKKK